MAGSKEIKRRIQSVRNTKQITSAMKMVSASKLRRVQNEVGKADIYQKKLSNILAAVAEHAGEMALDPLLVERPLKNSLYVVFASNKGLAGGYNSHLLKFALEAIKKDVQNGIHPSVIAVGKKAEDFFKRQGIAVLDAFLGVNDVPTSQDADAISRSLRSFYIKEETDAVYLIYQKFFTVMHQEPTLAKLLPVEKLPEAEDGQRPDYIFEPNAEAILEKLLPLYVDAQIHRALTDAKAGEHGARMTAMTAATDNATELIADLELSYNRARQAAITAEITEIVAGVNALS